MGGLSRRAWLRFVSTLGAAGASGYLSEALARGDLPPGIHRLDGTARVNGREAAVGTPVTTGDRVETGRASRAVIVVGGDAFLLRAESSIQLRGEGLVLSALDLVRGQVLSVFAKKPVAIRAGHASIGIRGTGAYLEVEPASVYFCLCYGEAVVDGPGMASKLVKTTHHEQPLILREDGSIMSAEPAPFRNHSDEELILLESLVGREPPFVRDGTYPSKKY